MPTRNQGALDRVVRGAGGVALVSAAARLGFGSPLGALAVAAGGVLIFTAATGFCPLYRLLGIDTAKSH